MGSPTQQQLLVHYMIKFCITIHITSIMKAFFSFFLTTFSKFSMELSSLSGPITFKFVTCKCIMCIRYVHDDPCFSKFSKMLFPWQLDFNIKRTNQHKYIWAVSVWWEPWVIFHTGYWWNTSSWGHCYLANERGKRRCLLPR